MIRMIFHVYRAIVALPLLFGDLAISHWHMTPTATFILVVWLYSVSRVVKKMRRKFI